MIRISTDLDTNSLDPLPRYVPFKGVNRYKSEPPEKEVTKMESKTRKALRLLSGWYLVACVIAILSLTIYAVTKEVFALASLPWGTETFTVVFVLSFVAIIYGGE